ncbi:MAG: hypothetical protein ACR2H4_12820 [Pyrinomonadaceae bacterium]
MGMPSLSALLYTRSGASEVDNWLHSFDEGVGESLSGNDVEGLLESELAGQRMLLQAWDEWFGFEVSSLYLVNTLAKRVIYTHKPYLYCSPWPGTRFTPKGINTRVHLALDCGASTKSTRLEAISQIQSPGFSSYYAFRIQYARDRRDRLWQIIYPALFLDSQLYHMIKQLDEDGRRVFLRSFRLMMSFASHDYIHATMMRWFEPPVLDSSVEYRTLVFEQGIPCELREWHDFLSASIRVRTISGEVIRVRDILEYQAVFIHISNIQHLISSEVLSMSLIRGLLRQIDNTAEEVFDKESGCKEHLRVIMIWFLLSMFRIETVKDLVEDIELRIAGETDIEYVATRLFWGFYRTVNAMTEIGFSWGSAYRDVRVPFLHYAACLRSYASDELP